MTRGCIDPSTAGHARRHRRAALHLALCGALIAQGLPAIAQTAGASADGPGPVRLARLSLGIDDNRGPVRAAQFMPGMPQMMVPQVEAAQGGGMGGGMTMVMTGDTMFEMMAGACTAGLFIGGTAAAVATAPAAPVAPGAIASAAAVGCGFAIAATAAGLAGMMGWRTAYNYFR